MHGKLITHNAHSMPISQPDPTTWDTFVSTHPAGHLLQLSGWGALKARYGWRAEIVDRSALLLFKRSMGLTLAYVPRGPVIDWLDRDCQNAVFCSLHEAARRGGASVLKVEPELADTPANRQIMLDLGFRPSTQTVQPRSTIIVDLSDGPEAALARMKSKWRYNVRLSERKGVTVRECSAADMATVGELMAATARRDNFDVHETAYYAAAFELLAPNHLTFLLAEYEGQPLGAIAVGVCGGLAWYLWGASSDLERNRMPNHALQWAGMQWAHARGATRYDLWGIPDEMGALAQGLRNGDGSGTPSDDLPVDVENLPSHGLWGVYRFKQGFGGNVVRMVGAWDKPVNPIGDAVYRVGLWAKRVQASVKSNQSSVNRDQSGHDSRLTTRVTTKSDWRATLSQFTNPHVLQSWEWGEVKSQTEWHADRIALPAGDAAFQFLYRQPLPFVPLRIGYVPKGPVVNWNDGALVERTLDALAEHARTRRCIVLKIDPDVREDSPEGKMLLATLARRGWRFSNEQIQFKNTGVTLLAEDETPLDDAALLDAMKSKTRYNVRLAQKRGVTMRLGDARDLDVFYALYAETGARDGFLIRPADYYRATWLAFLRAQQEPGSPTGGALLLADHPQESTPVAGLFLMRNGATTWYFYGASSERHRRDMPNYLLQFEAMRWAREQGCTRYDWWGAPTNPEDETDSMQGVWGFKQGFGAQLQTHIGAWDLPVSPLLYKGYTYALPRVVAWMRGAKSRGLGG
jgi:peptidoglycan pentaglycine glycine transferase (the first glycine)